MDGKPIQPSDEGADPSHADMARTDSPDPEEDSDSDGEASIKSTRSCSWQNLGGTMENGRRYCDGTYFMPNDEPELTRLNIVHQIYLMMLDGRLTTAPLTMEEPRILDVGTGPGDWAIEMSAEYPRASVIASDIGVFDSGLGHLSLPNVDFQLADAQSEWTYHEPFDLVHMRGLSGAFQDWHAIYRQAFTHLKPGGYLEVADADPAGDTMTNPDADESYIRIFAAAMRSAAESAGYPRDLLHLQTSALSAAGFVDVRVLERFIPIGLWPDDLHEKSLGKMALIAALEGLEAFALRPLTRSGCWSLDAARDLCEKVKGEFLTADRITARVRVVTGRKPVSYSQRREEVLARAMRKVRMYDGPAESESEPKSNSD
ncbi:hypothetical protein NUU61_009624 [Penicillium alfredii]|uniref:Uncharacterized protein n=1 Tax=Penicillium alfredii TaxID=1506179 RepID=A0A9W9JTQ6_9EURO|nr:uncharacterized protein NUU61_009624 [Penicillium alfredii]KAJ5081360.1 hypothetical protein NUU61_009624 [Penicillium alfredii]